MSQPKSIAELAERLDLHGKEIASLTEELLAMRRQHRADLDRTHLDIETLKRLLEIHNPGFGDDYTRIRGEANWEVSPE